MQNGIDRNVNIRYFTLLCYCRILYQCPYVLNVRSLVSPWILIFFWMATGSGRRLSLSETLLSDKVLLTEKFLFVFYDSFNVKFLSFVF